MNNFSNLQLSQQMVKNLDLIGYSRMTSVQEKSLPYILENYDLIVKAKTGSGKTAAFGIGLLQKLDVKKFKVQSLILCPTRELAQQVANELRMIAKFQHNIKILTLCGGVAYGPQYGSLRHGAHVVVGTPGRVLKHLKKDSLNLDDLDILVLDEADRMLDMGFIEEVEELISFVPKKRQTLLFSATYPDEIAQLSRSIQKDAIEIEIESIDVENKIDERFYNISNYNKTDALVKVLASYKPSSAIIFCNTKLECDELAKELQNKKIDALSLHGDLEQYERLDVLTQFSNLSCAILIATDVAARGLDIKELPLVVNYDMPNTQDVYTHRIGRTGRAGAVGIAVSFYEDSDVFELYNNEKRVFADIDDINDVDDFEMQPAYITIVIEGGKKDKLRKGDILGAVTSSGKLNGNDIGKIDIYDKQSYVAIDANKIDLAYNELKKGKVKGKKFSVWVL
ncbi:MAG: ATP-dependent RNA helicase DbpA [Campylobacterales bacterium]|nr:ATP-dependent RNA helicase DbpA [Campylobacterales bacterium]